MKNMVYRLVFSKEAERQVDKLDSCVRKSILKWLAKNVDGTSNPRLHEKPFRQIARGSGGTASGTIALSFPLRTIASSFYASQSGTIGKFTGTHIHSAQPSLVFEQANEFW